MDKSIEELHELLVKGCITSEELIELGYLEPLKRDDDVCSGYAIIHVDDNYQYDVYITCDKYTTRGYQEQ